MPLTMAQFYGGCLGYDYLDPFTPLRLNPIDHRMFYIDNSSGTNAAINVRIDWRKYPKGYEFWIINETNANVISIDITSVDGSVAGLIVNMTANRIYRFTLVDNVTEEGSWQVYTRAISSTTGVLTGPSRVGQMPSDLQPAGHPSYSPTCTPIYKIDPCGGVDGDEVYTRDDFSSYVGKTVLQSSVCKNVSLYLGDPSAVTITAGVAVPTAEYKNCSKCNRKWVLTSCDGDRTLIASNDLSDYAHKFVRISADTTGRCYFVNEGAGTPTGSYTVTDVYENCGAPCVEVKDVPCGYCCLGCAGTETGTLSCWCFDAGIGLDECCEGRAGPPGAGVVVDDCSPTPSTYILAPTGVCSSSCCPRPQPNTCCTYTLTRLC